MLVPGMGAATDVARENRHRPWDRRAREDPPNSREPDAPPPVVEEGVTYDVASYANRFKSQIWRLNAYAEEPAPPDRDGDNRLFDFFGHLNLLLLAVREGDIARARAAADALEMEVLAERIVEPPPGPPAAPRWAGNFGALSNPADPYDEFVAAEDTVLADLPAGDVAYDTLTQYRADDAPVV